MGAFAAPSTGRRMRAWTGIHVRSQSAWSATNTFVNKHAPLLPPAPADGAARPPAWEQRVELPSQRFLASKSAKAGQRTVTGRKCLPDCFLGSVKSTLHSRDASK